MTGLLDGIEQLLGGREESAWSGSVEDLLYDGETVEATVDLDANRVVVTSHRVLAITPEGDGENFRQVDRPNVDDVRAGSDGDEDLLYRALRTGIYGVLMLAVGLTVDVESFLPTTSIDTEGAGQIGVGGIFETMNQFLQLIGKLDELLQAFGALALLLVTVFLGAYLLTRDRVLVVEVAGNENILVPAEKATAEAAVTDLEAALFGGGPGVAAEAISPTEAGVSGESVDPTEPDSKADEAADGTAGGPADDARFKSDDPL